MLAAAGASAGQAARAQQQSTSTGTQLQIPESYICPMHGDILEDKAGSCPICKMELEPVRIEQAWSCPGNTARIFDKPGKCPMSPTRDLVPITVAHFYECKDVTKRFADPGKCADGSARIERREVRAHGDHNPRHNGLFYMAEDQWHHLEGTYPSAGLFRVYIYDNFTKPISPSEFSGRVDRKENGQVVDGAPLVLSKDRQTLEARLKPSAAPVDLEAFIKFNKSTREQPFSFPFKTLTTEPAAPAVTTTRAPSAPPPTPTAQAAAPAPAPAPAPTETPAQASDPKAPLILDKPLQVPPALAEALDESKLPQAAPELLAELTKRTKEVETLVAQGEISQVWLPAMGTKTVAIVLDSHASALPARQRIAATAAIKRIVTAAWEIDNYGDLGNGKKIAEAYQRLASAVTDLKAAYAQ